VRDQGFSNTNGGQGFSSNGLRGRNNDQEIDGQNNNDNSVAGPALFVSDTEFVQQYVLITNQFGPEYGRNAGSVVNVITKSGTNSWHGSIYANENNSILNSMNNGERRFDTDLAGNRLTDKPRLNDEFSGFTIGGPLVKNKAFIFGGFDNELLSTNGIFHSDGLTPTPTGLATLNGCFPTSTTLQAFNKFGPYGIGGAVAPTRDPNNPDANGNPQFDLIDVGNPGTPCIVEFGGVTRELKQPFHGFNFVNRVDYQRGNDNFMARYLFNRGNNFNADFGDGAAGYPVSVPALSQAILVGWTHNLSSRMVNEARVGFNRLNVDFGGNTIGTVPLGTAEGVQQALARVNFNSGAFMAYGTATNLPQLRIVNTWQAQDNWNYVVGKHTFKAGVNYTFQRSPNVFLPTVNGAYRFSNWNAFINNVPNRVQVAAGDPTLDFREHDTFLYVGDDWKIGQSLTLNLGLTWSYYGQPANLFNQITTQRESNPATALWNPAVPLSARTFPEFPAPKNSWGPSLGFAYNPQWGGFLTGNGKTTIRGGYRLLYDPPFYNIYLNMSSSAPEVFLNSFNAATSPAASTLQLPADPHGPNVRASLNPFLLKGVFDPRSFSDTTMAPNFGPDKVHSWSLGIEREVTKNSAVELRYVGNHGTDLFQSINANPFINDLARDFPSLVPAGITPCALGTVIPGPGQADTQSALGFGRVNCDQGVVRSRTNTGFSNYNGVQAEFRANNLFKQLTLRAGYTFQKTLDNVSEIFGTFGGGTTTAFAQNPFNQTGEYGFSGLDIPQQFTVLFTEEIPFLKEQHGLAGRIFGGWAVSGNYIIGSGQHYTPVQVVTQQIFNAFTGSPDYWDLPFTGFSGAELEHPYLGNINAPSTAVGMYAGDACFLFSLTGADPLCGGNPNQLVSLTAVGRSGCETNSNIGCPFTPVTNNDVRFIVNSPIANQVFGTPFGNAPRNGKNVTDAITNVANASVFKRIKFNERSSFELRFSALNVFNHPNYSSVDPIIEDAGLFGSFTGFGDVTTTGTSYPGYNGGQRRFTVGGTFRF
jgi:hypothetical protein